MAIDVAALKSEFGTYIGTNQKQLLKKLTQKTVSMGYMTTIKTDDLEYRMAKAVIDNIVQGFQKKWTPKGTASFTPISIVQRRHKFDYEFYPDDVVDSWLGFLADLNEGGDRKTWPITRYVMDNLILPKVNDNRELLLIGKGVYAAPVDEVAQNTGLSMDGFCTILENKRAAGTSSINFYNDSTKFVGDPTESNIVDFVEGFVDFIDELYQGMEMPIFCSNAWYKAYKRKYRDIYGGNSDFQRTNADQIDYSNNRLIPLPSMAGKNTFFCTPKENFIRLTRANDGASKIWMDSDKRLVLISADWHESVGFGMEEAIFAYTPDESASA